ncbi:TPA_asm: ead/Ea22-like family protein [Salmonella enterica subsp. enterica serovar Typhimurium]|uniref:Ead/Ea22-like family protein n=1 Tax=Salmonella typhimurium TaxID=90371 RepID=A0A727CB11_SALTM|nr:ead/Ea22-like family protein [Salmonella enterica]EBP3649471.1 ead/Ea22-like family protein [Salmonella enterica subsp. enterica]EEE8965926.1 ead/Ea22-like family protein [Salmonella enterica subsp. enterica serovar Typhimurium]EBA9563879.1 ead/Ea22-like family protein [Salmonella enterica]EBD5184806.1 ead/Ea22-like family protein [Salmonella enterica]
MSKIDYQALRELAKQATQGEWVAFISSGTGTYAVHTPGDKRCEDVIKWTGFDGQNNAENNARYIAAFNPEVVQALLDEREAQSKRIAELEEKAAPDSFGIIGENIRTQDNRITSDPMFCVYQKREIVVDADYDYDRIVWVDEDGNEANKRQSRRLELLHENFREPPEKWRRVAVKDIDEFVTCCFTEQGCKDYLAANGHNLRLPFIYVKSGFRNAEYIGIRNWLAGIRIKGE